MPRFLKRLLDLVIAVLVLGPLIPLLLLIALVIKLDSEGPILFVQERLGLNGVTFRMYKFRTMVKDAERIGTGLFSYRDDPRVTRVGKYLRLASLDELPQIFNVLKGDMSIVGPRPPVTYELGDYSTFSDELKNCFIVKPGITGLAQVSGRNDLDWPQKIRYTNEYIRRYHRHGIGVDLLIILKTIVIVLSMKNVVERQAGD